MIDKEKVVAMEYIRQMGGTTAAAIEFGAFAVGFPPSMDMAQIYTAYMAAKYGPEQVSMDTYMEDSK